MIFYFAYGSNLHHFQMKKRCPNCKFIKKMILNDYFLTFRSKYGVADIHTWDWSWTPGGYIGWRHQTPLGPTVTEGYRSTAQFTGVSSSNSAGIPSWTRWNVGASYRCQNITTGRNSGANIWQNSGIYYAG